MIKTHDRLGRSLVMTPGLKRYFELVHEWKTNKKDRKIDNLPALTFKEWTKKNGYNVDKETSQAVKEAPTRL